MPGRVGRKSIIESNQLTEQVIALRRDQECSFAEITRHIESSIGKSISRHVVPYFFKKRGDPLSAVDRIQAQHQGVVTQAKAELERVTHRSVATDEDMSERIFAALWESIAELAVISNESENGNVRVRAHEVRIEALLELHELIQETQVTREIMAQVQAAA